MIFAAFKAAFGWVSALPRWMHGALAFAALITAIVVWDHFDDRAAIREHERELQAAIEAKDEAADDAAIEAAGQAKTTTEAENDEAREAAAGSDDHLKSGLDRLR